MTRTISVRTVWKSLPPFELKAPGTFSQTIYLGRTLIPDLPFRRSFFLISFTIRSWSMNRPLRVVSSSPLSSCLRPLRSPATDKSWQGLPPVITSTGGISAPLIFVISPRCFTLSSSPLDFPPNGLNIIQLRIANGRTVRLFLAEFTRILWYLFVCHPLPPSFSFSRSSPIFRA